MLALKRILPRSKNVCTRCRLHLVFLWTVLLGTCCAQSFGELAAVARSGDAAPGGDIFSVVADPLLNNLGQVAFNGTAGGVGGFYLGDGSGLDSVVRVGDTAPGGGTFSSVSDPLLNDLGQVAFTGIAGGVSGLYLGDGVGLKSVVRIGDAAPGGDTFSSVSNPQLNDDGQVAFTATAGGASGFFLGDGVDLVEIVRIGDTAPDGGTFSSVSNPWLNDLGQVAFNATIGFDSGIYAFTPDLQWRPPGDDNWDDNENWTLNIAPAAVHDTSIDPDTELTVIGPSSDTTVKSLTLGGGAGTASLDLGLAMITTAIGDYVQNDLSNLLIEILNETSHGGIRAAGAVTIDGALVFRHSLIFG